MVKLDDITGFGGSAAEVTLEANPESLDSETAQAAKEHGVNRLSIGVQSLRHEVLDAYDRVHSPEDALEAYEVAREVGFRRINMDLIFAFPGQDQAEWTEDLETVLRLRPEHVSAYELTYEPGTALTKLRDAGRWPATGQERCLELFDLTRRTCANHGYEDYEVSNFARQGAGCLHNLAYWRSLDWIGIGAGASSWHRGWRRKNFDLPETYEAELQSTSTACSSREQPPSPTLLFEVFMMGLRLPGEGVCLPRAERLTGLSAWKQWPEQLPNMIEQGLLETGTDSVGNPRIRATEKGLLILDSLLVQLLPKLQV